MSSPLASIIGSGSKLWLDSIDPDLVAESRQAGLTGATSNPIIVTDLIETGRFDAQMADLFAQGLDDEAVAWALTDHLVGEAQRAFMPVWEATSGNDGYVSFELDPLLEDPESGPPHPQRVARYVELGQRWSEGQSNRMIKVPATAAGLAALEDLAAAGVTLNVTLIFSPRQYLAARDAIWRGAQRRGATDRLKSVYSIFVSRVDVYAEAHVPELSDSARGQVGIVNAKRIWGLNRAFWHAKGLALDQEIVFASTGTKRPEDPADKYVRAFAGDDIETNPPATNAAVEALGRTYTAEIEQLPAEAVLAEIDARVDFALLERTLMAEGIRKFADPHKALLGLVAARRTTRARK